MADEKQSEVSEQQVSTPKTLEETIVTKAVDTVHQDEALLVLAQYAGDEAWTPEEEKKLVRRIDGRLLTLLIITYGLQYYDKAMLSQAVSYLYIFLLEGTQLTMFRLSSDCARTYN